MAQMQIGEMYANGIGVQQNDVQAMHWYLKSANSEWLMVSQAQATVGFMYEKGRGVRQDLKKQLAGILNQPIKALRMLNLTWVCFMEMEERE